MIELARRSYNGKEWYYDIVEDRNLYINELLKIELHERLQPFGSFEELYTEALRLDSNFQLNIQPLLVMGTETELLKIKCVTIADLIYLTNEADDERVRFVIRCLKIDSLTYVKCYEHLLSVPMHNDILTVFRRLFAVLIEEFGHSIEFTSNEAKELYRMVWSQV